MRLSLVPVVSMVQHDLPTTSANEDMVSLLVWVFRSRLNHRPTVAGTTSICILLLCQVKKDTSIWQDDEITG